MLRWIVVVKLIGALVLGLTAMGSMTACGTIEGIGKDISALGEVEKAPYMEGKIITMIIMPK